MSAELDHEATTVEATVIAAHLDGCGQCRQWRLDVQDLNRLLVDRFEERLDPGPTGWNFS